MNAATTKRNAGSRASAFTLLEMLVTVSLTTVLMIGLGTAILLASHALPTKETPSMRLAETGDVLDRMADELHAAVHIVERSPTAVTFTVADRDGNGSPEAIRYAWSGTAGDPLTRQYNHGTAAPVLEDVEQFDLTYNHTRLTESYPGPAIESAETLLSSSDGPIGSGKNAKIDDWHGQYFAPALAAEVQSWKVTRVSIMQESTFYTFGTGKVGLWPATGGNLPGPAAIEEVDYTDLGLPYPVAWRDYTFSSVTGLAPGQGLCLVVLGTSGDIGKKAGKVYLRFSGGSEYLNSDGVTWTSDPITGALYYAYGTTITPGPSQAAARDYVSRVGINVQSGAAPVSRVDTAIHTGNTPEALSAVWELDFDVDPTTQDMNADNAGDADRRDGQTFDTTNLVGGVWFADATLDTFPLNDFTELTTVEVRMRNTSIGGNGAVFEIRVDWDGLLFTAPIFAHLRLQANGTQTLTVYRQLASLVLDPLVTVSSLPNDFVTVRLLIDPDLDTVNVRVDGTDHGTFTYSRFLAINNNRFATIEPSGSNAKFDYLYVRVGGNAP